MTELHLHQLWRSKRLPFHQLYTTDQKAIAVIHVGEYNTGSGPDFFNGQIEVDGLRLSGNIEMHLKSSDWYAHGHQNDRAYDNVILHVVHHYDTPVLINGKEVLTLELGELVYWLGKELPGFAASPIPCGDQLSGSGNLPGQLNRVLVERLDRKAQRYFSSKHPVQVFFEAVSESFGRKVNALPFLALAQNIRVELLTRLSPLQRKSIILGMSGMTDFTVVPEDWQREWKFLQSCHALYELDPVVWKTKGNRPASFPKNKISQLANAAAVIDWFYPFWEDSECEIIAYWKKVFELSSGEKLSADFINHILINAVVPFLYFLGKQRKNEQMTKKAFEVLKKLNPERNAIIDRYKNMGVNLRNASDTQALLEQYRNWCMPKKCLDCRVGNQILIK